LLFSGQIAIFRAIFFRPPSKMPARTPMAIITTKYYTKVCTIRWSSYHGSLAKPVQNL